MLAQPGPATSARKWRESNRPATANYVARAWRRAGSGASRAAEALEGDSGPFRTQPQAQATQGGLRGPGPTLLLHIHPPTHLGLSAQIWWEGEGGRLRVGWGGGCAELGEESGAPPAAGERPGGRGGAASPGLPGALELPGCPYHLQCPAFFASVPRLERNHCFCFT